MAAFCCFTSTLMSACGPLRFCSGRQPPDVSRRRSLRVPRSTATEGTAWSERPSSRRAKLTHDIRAGGGTRHRPTQLHSSLGCHRCRPRIPLSRRRGGKAYIDWRSSSPFHSWYALDVRRARVASCTAAASARTFSPRRTDFPPGILPRDYRKTECDYGVSLTMTSGSAAQLRIYVWSRPGGAI